MESRETTGRALRGGETLASEILLTERAEAHLTALPTPGSNRFSHRQRVFQGESTIRFLELEDPTLESELETMVAASSDINLKRRLRDENRTSTTVDLALEDGRNLAGCVLRYPSPGPAQLEVTDFPILLLDPKA